MSILAKTISPRGALSFEVGYHPRKKIHVIRVVFQARQCTRVHCLGVQKRKKKKKKRKGKRVFLVILTNIGKDMAHKLT